MNELRNEKLEDYYEAAESWSDDRVEAYDRSRQIAWIIAGVSLALAFIMAIALVLLIPLKREVPYTLLVDRQTGYVEALQPLDQRVLTADDALANRWDVTTQAARLPDPPVHVDPGFVVAAQHRVVLEQERGRRASQDLGLGAE